MCRVDQKKNGDVRRMTVTHQEVRVCSRLSFQFIQHYTVTQTLQYCLSLARYRRKKKSIYRL